MGIFDRDQTYIKLHNIPNYETDYSKRDLSTRKQRRQARKDLKRDIEQHKSKVSTGYGSSKSKLTGGKYESARKYIKQLRENQLIDEELASHDFNDLYYQYAKIMNGEASDEEKIAFNEATRSPEVREALALKVKQMSKTPFTIQNPVVQADPITIKAHIPNALDVQRGINYQNEQELAKLAQNTTSSNALVTQRRAAQKPVVTSVQIGDYEPVNVERMSYGSDDYFYFLDQIDQRQYLETLRTGLNNIIKNYGLSDRRVQDLNRRLVNGIPLSGDSTKYLTSDELRYILENGFSRDVLDKIYRTWVYNTTTSPLVQHQLAESVYHRPNIPVVQLRTTQDLKENPVTSR